MARLRTIKPVPLLGFRVYALRDPRDGKCFYIGRSNMLNERMCIHMNEARRGMQTPKCDRIREIVAAGLKPLIHTIGLARDDEHVRKLERQMIYEMRSEITNLRAY